MLLFDSHDVSHLTREERSPGSVAEQKAPTSLESSAEALGGVELD
jgi:hypothetical protein